MPSLGKASSARVIPVCRECVSTEMGAFGYCRVIGDTNTQIPHER